MLTGENGILSRSQETNGINAYTSAEEQGKLAYMAVKTEIMAQKVKDSSYNAQTNGTTLATMVGNELKGTEWSTPTYNSTSKAIEITYTNSSLRAGMVGTEKPKHDGYLEFTIGLSEKDATLSIDGVEVSGGNQDSEESADPTAKFGEANATYIDKFGKIVTGTSVPSVGSNWRLFYADSNYAYLISDSIGNYALNNTNIIKGWETSTISTLAQNFNSQYTANGDWTLKPNGTDLNNAVKAVAALLDKDEWEEYESADAEWAVGAPTLEMFVASYNATHSSAKASTLGVSQHQIACNVDAPSWTGYKVSIDNSIPNVTISGLGNTSLLDQAIYCSGNGYWLASPSAYDAGYVMVVSNSIYVELYGYFGWNDKFGVRPLVCVPISKINNGITITDNY